MKTHRGDDSHARALLEVRDLKVHFRVKREPSAWAAWRAKGLLRAVDGVSFDIGRGETVGLVGESGCGKSTLARAIVGLSPVTSGSIRWQGAETVNDGRRPAAALQALRRGVQMIFQDPLASLDPRMTIGRIVAEPLRTRCPHMARAEVRARVATMLERVGLNARYLERYPHEFSGGQCQRIGIARALIAEPQLVVCDEPVSALDVSIQAQVVNLLRDLQRELSLSMLFVAHDLAVVKSISHRVLVMYLGRVMEVAERQALYADPRHPYTRALLNAVPVANPVIERNRSRVLLKGDLPSPLDPPTGCAFRTRCPDSIESCAQRVPQLEVLEGKSRSVACIRALSP
ncbi:MAG: oligopeptide transport system ATP-binding protein [Paraburkholderia sp.]|nr:oligopeptide transport system ATP-binding protein [Paraburkholderia sp.]